MANPVYVDGKLVSGNEGGARAQNSGGPLKVTISPNPNANIQPSHESALSPDVQPTDPIAYLDHIDAEIDRFEREYPGQAVSIIEHARWLAKEYRGTVSTLQRVAKAYTDLKQARAAESTMLATETPWPEQPKSVVTIKSAEDIAAEAAAVKAAKIAEIEEALRVARES